MTWRDRLRPASFGGVPFEVELAERAGGRRVGVHQFPQRDTPFVEDLGAEARSIRIEGFILGDDFVARTQQLVDRLGRRSPDAPRPGQVLVHPSLGDLRVVCVRHLVQDLAVERGRGSRVSMEFVEAGDDVQPFQASNPVGAADEAAASASSSAGDAFAAGARVSGTVEESRTAIEDQFREVVRIVRAADVFSGPSRQVDALEDALTSISIELASLVQAPAILYSRTRSALERVLQSARAPFLALEAYQGLFGLEGEEVPGISDQSASVRDNSAAAALAIRVLAVSGAVRAAARSDFATLDDALEVRRRLQAELDALEPDVDSDSFFALGALRSALVGSVPPPEADLPELEVAELPKTTPALVVAHRLYQDAERGDEVVARNNVSHPLRVPGAVQLSVLSR